MSTVNKKLFGQSLVTDPSGYRIALGKNTVEDTKNFDAEALNNIRVKKYNITFENNVTNNLLQITDIPEGAMIWDIKIYVTTPFNEDGAYILLRDTATGNNFYISWNISPGDSGFIEDVASEVPKLQSSGVIEGVETSWIDVRLTAFMPEGVDLPTEGVADIYVQYSILD